MQMFIAISLIIAQTGDNPSTSAWIDKVWGIFMERHSVSKRNELIHVTIWVNLKNIVLSEISYIRMTTCHVSIQHSRRGETVMMQSRKVVARAWSEGVIAEGHEGTLGDEKNITNLVSGGGNITVYTFTKIL